MYQLCFRKCFSVADQIEDNETVVVSMQKFLFERSYDLWQQFVSPFEINISQEASSVCSFWYFNKKNLFFLLNYWVSEDASEDLRVIWSSCLPFSQEMIFTRMKTVFCWCDICVTFQRVWAQTRDGVADAVATLLRC